MRSGCASKATGRADRWILHPSYPLSPLSPGRLSRLLASPRLGRPPLPPKSPAGSRSSSASSRRSSRSLRRPRSDWISQSACSPRAGRNVGRRLTYSRAIAHGRCGHPPLSRKWGSAVGADHAVDQSRSCPMGVLGDNRPGWHSFRRRTNRGLRHHSPATADRVLHPVNRSRRSTVYRE